MVYNFKSFVGLAQQEALATQNEAVKLANQGFANNTFVNTGHAQEYAAQNQVMTEQVNLTQ
jgi:hypothetical protein